MTDCAEIVNRLVEGLRSSFEVEPLGQGCLLVCPFTRPDGGAIEITVVTDATGRLRFSDAGESVDYLFANGLEVFKNQSHLRQLNRIAGRFGVDFADGELAVAAAADQAGAALHRIVSAAQEASCLVFRRAERTVTTFDDEVEKLLIAQALHYDRGYQIQGATKEHQVAFHLNGTGDRLVDPMSANSRSSAEAKAERLVFKWNDIKQVRPEVRGIAIIDDRTDRGREAWAETPFAVLKRYSDAVVSWSARDQVLRVISGAQLGLTDRPAN